MREFHISAASRPSISPMKTRVRAPHPVHSTRAYGRSGSLDRTSLASAAQNGHGFNGTSGVTLPMRTLLGVLVVTLLGCEPSASEVTGDYVLPPELSDCTIHSLSSGGIASYPLYVIRCPHSTTTTKRVAKNPRYATIDSP